jgi:DNA invertase Pin-like site-specific DNA recombinase
MKAYSYLRISRPEQRTGDGIRRQLQATKEYCAEVGLELDTFPMTDSGLSGFRGTNLEKGALGVFKNAVDKGKIQVPCALVVENLDRITRQNIETAVGLLLGLVGAGVEVHTVMDKKVYRKGEMDMTSMLISIVILSRGHEESLTKSKRLLSAWEKKRASALEYILTSHCPGWLKPKKDFTGFDTIPERVAVVQEIFDLTINGISKAKISAMLNTRQEPVWGWKKRAGMRWHDSYLEKMLNGRIVLGEYQPHRRILGVRTPEGDTIKGYYPQIITEEVWQKAATSRASRLRHRVSYPDPEAPRNLLQGRIYLNGARALWINKGKRRSSDGARHTKKRIPGYWIYYITKIPATGKVQFRMRRELAESMIVGRLLNIDANDLTTAPAFDPRVTRKFVLEERIKELEEGISRMVSSIRTTKKKDLPSAIIKQITTDERAVEAARIELKSLEGVTDDNELVREQIPNDVEAIRNLAIEKDDVKTREKLARLLAEIIDRVDLATTPDHLPDWCRKGAMTLATLYQGEVEGEDAAAGWVAVTLRDGSRVAGFATGDPLSPKIITVKPSVDVPKGRMVLMIGAGTLETEQHWEDPKETETKEIKPKEIKPKPRRRRKPKPLLPKT